MHKVKQNSDSASGGITSIQPSAMRPTNVQERPSSRPAGMPEITADRLTDLARSSKTGALLGTKTELKDRLGVALGTFNEGLRLAQARGVVTVKSGPGGGIFAAAETLMARFGNAVLRLDSEDTKVSDAIRVRGALEWLVVEDALQNSSPADIAAMRQELTVMKKSVNDDDGMAFLQSNWRLHQCIVSTTPNEILRSLYTSLLEVVESHTTSVSSPTTQPLNDFHVQRYQIHVDMVDAIESGDREAAADSIEKHNAEFRS